MTDFDFNFNYLNRKWLVHIDETFVIRYNSNIMIEHLLKNHSYKLRELIVNNSTDNRFYTVFVYIKNMKYIVRYRNCFWYIYYPKHMQCNIPKILMLANKFDNTSPFNKLHLSIVKKIIGYLFFLIIRLFVVYEF